jgi:hypothetical protein
MIEAQLKLRFRRDAHVVILPNYTALAGVIHGLDDLLPADVTTTPRPLEALRVNDIVEDCELVDRLTGDRFNVPEGVRWKVKELEVQPAAADHPERVFTLVRVP